ncbi:MAG: phage holin family protein [Humibacillus sp.]|nr:phage holin family protein [Humibacillus sp.]MDN5778119.1 phage holin family protein [Humibacillus sp.]
MIRLAVRTLIFLGSAAIGLLVAAALVDGLSVSFGGFVIAVVIFAAVQSVLSPFLAKLAHTHARVLLGGIGLVSTVVALFAATLIGSSLQITGGIRTWALATFIVWLTTAIATILLPIALVKAGVQSARERRTSP